MAGNFCIRIVVAIVSSYGDHIADSYICTGSMCVQINYIIIIILILHCSLNIFYFIF